jgi:phosphoribosylglycinamide formyltransferase 2
LAHKTAENFTINGIEKALTQANTDIRIFGKPTIRPYRRMGISLVYDHVNADMDALRKKAKVAADCIEII